MPYSHGAFMDPDQLPDQHMEHPLVCAWLILSGLLSKIVMVRTNQNPTLDSTVENEGETPAIHLFALRADHC